MPLSGELLIGRSRVRGRGGDIRGFNPATGETLPTVFGGADLADLEQACALAAEASAAYAETPPQERARFLEAIAQAILDIGDELIDRCVAESGLPRGRIEGERGRTVGQLRLFAQVVRQGDDLEVRIDPAQPARTPAPRPDLRQRHVALGPVAVFGASNFPLAFSVAGGDTASALAAGCPVVAKAHSAHPGTSELVGRALQAAVEACGLPEGVFSLLFDAGLTVGQGLAADPRIKAVAFTGSRRGGLALMQIAAVRPEPVPVYAEMSSINPVLLLPGALAERGAEIGAAFVGSLVLGAGQFCTNPGLVIGVDGKDLDAFSAAAAAAVARTEATTMLTPGIHEAYEAGAARLSAHAAVERLAVGAEGGGLRARPALFSATARQFLAHPDLQHEVFGPAGLILRCADLAEMQALLEGLEGQLTIALHIAAGDHAAVRALLPTAQRKAGRILFNGFGTGVEVGHAMVHGGPYPATSDGRSTSVGGLAIRRFLRPVCYQDMPADLLPPALRDDNPWGLRRRIDGEIATT